MSGRLKTRLRQSEFVVHAGRAAKALISDAKKCYWAATRMRQIKQYITTHDVTKLQLGTSDSVKQGWLNTDLTPKRSDVIYLDAARRFPFQDETFDCVYSEHMIEHLDYGEAKAMLQECSRVLKPGGRVRMATPDLAALLGVYGPMTDSIQQRYVDARAKRFIPEAKRHKSVFVINYVFRAWGHKFLYDASVLSDLMSEAGFVNTRQFGRGVSDDVNLQNLETHGGMRRG